MTVLNLDVIQPKQVYLRDEELTKLMHYVDKTAFRRVACIIRLESKKEKNKMRYNPHTNSKIQVIEQHQLSNGDTVRVTKLGRQYSFVRLFCEDQAPYMEQGISLKWALSRLAGALQQDVCEVD